MQSVGLALEVKFKKKLKTKQRKQNTYRASEQALLLSKAYVG